MWPLNYPDNIDPNAYYSIAAAAKAFGVCRQTMNECYRQGRIKSHSNTKKRLSGKDLIKLWREKVL